MWELASLSATAASMHTVFSTECTSFFDWQSVGLFYSHQEVLQPGYITRLMACDHPEGYAGANIGPTHVHPNYGNPKNNHVHDRYTPYNKPGALQHWLDNTYQETEQPPEYVLLVDPDTIFRKPIDCHRELGVRPGVAASSPRPYLEGVDNGMAAQFVSPEALGRIDKVTPKPNPKSSPKPQPNPNPNQVGGFLCLHIDDLRKVVPLWINFTVQMRKNPQRYWQINGVGEDFPTGAPRSPAHCLATQSALATSLPPIPRVCLRRPKRGAWPRTVHFRHVRVRLCRRRGWAPPLDPPRCTADPGQSAIVRADASALRPMVQVWREAIQQDVVQERL